MSAKRNKLQAKLDAARQVWSLSMTVVRQAEASITAAEKAKLQAYNMLQDAEVALRQNHGESTRDIRRMHRQGRAAQKEAVTMARVARAALRDAEYTARRDERAYRDAENDLRKLDREIKRAKPVGPKLRAPRRRLEDRSWLLEDEI